MSRICDICNKGYLKGNLVPRGIGRRVTNRAIKRQQPNIRKKKLVIDGKAQVVNICASCLKRVKFEQRKWDEINKEKEEAKLKETRGNIKEVKETNVKESKETKKKEIKKKKETKKKKE